MSNFHASIKLRWLEIKVGNTGRIFQKHYEWHIYITQKFVSVECLQIKVGGFGISIIVRITFVGVLGTRKAAITHVISL